MDEDEEVNKVRYKVAKEVAKKVVIVAKSMAYDMLYQKLEIEEKDKEVFKLMRAKKIRTRDLCDVRFIKDEDRKMLAKEVEINGKGTSPSSSTVKCWKIFRGWNERVVRGNVILDCLNLSIRMR